VRAGFLTAMRDVFKQFHGLETKTCPFKNLPRGAARPVGRRIDGRGDGEMPLGWHRDW
jgi:hypothetical protein